jgi:glycine dehydrogenase subunit 2
MNLHKTFSTPHGGGGPGAGAVGVSERLKPFLPVPLVVKDGDDYRQAMHADCPQSIGQLSAFGGNAGVLLRAYVYARLLGAEGMRRVGEYATLNANYLAARLREAGFDLAYPERRASHEFIVTVQRQKKENGITALDFSKSLLDYDIHAPTNYFPLLVPECLLIEPTETESKDVLDRFVEVMAELLGKSRTEPGWMKGAPYATPVRRLDDVKAARDLDLGYVPPKAPTADLNAGEPAHI